MRSSPVIHDHATRSFHFDVVAKVTGDVVTHDLAGNRYAHPVQEDRLEISIERDGKRFPVALLSIAEILAELDDPNCDDVDEATG
jgi:hypothetical protein